MISKISFKLVFSLASLLTVTAAAGQISVPAVVVDASGKSVHGLQKTDFEVRCGKGASFDSVEEVPPLKFSGFADPVPVFILFDEVSIRPPEQGEVSRLLLNYLRKAADDHIAVTLLANTANGVIVIHDMSTDQREFAAAMDRVLPKEGQPVASPVPSGPADDFTKAVNEEAVQLQQLTKMDPPLSLSGQWQLQSNQLGSLRLVGKMLEHARKRKPLVWISDSFPIDVENGELTFRFDYRGSANSMDNGHVSEPANVLTAAYQGAIDSLNNAHVSLYPVSLTRGRSGKAFSGDDYTRDGLRQLASRTGGDLSLGSHEMDLASALGDIRQHFDSYYLLSFTIQSGRKRTWIDSSIKVSKPDAKITAASGFFSSHE